MSTGLDVRWTSLVLAGVVAGAVLGIALGQAWGGGALTVLAVVLGVIAVLVVSWRPLVGVALVPAAVGFGNDPVPGAPADLQAVHALIGLALVGVLLHWLLADRPRLRAPTLPARRALSALAAFVAASVVSGLVGRTPYVSLTMNVTLVGVALLTGAVVLVVTDHRQLRLLLCVLVASSVAATAPVLRQTGAVDAERGGTVVDNRPTGAFVDPNELGAYAAVVLVVALLLLCSPRRWEALVGAVGGACAALAVVLSFSRGSWVAAAVGVVLLLLLVPELRARLVVRVAGAGALAASLLATPLVTLPADAVIARASTLISGATNPYDVRPHIWDLAWSTFLESPLLGAGPGAYPQVAADAPGLLWAYPVVHAHNGALTVAAENGALGLVAASTAVVAVAAGVLLRVRTLPPDRGGPRATALGLLVALCAAGATLVVDYTLRNPLVLMNLWLLVGAAVAASQLPDPPERPDPAGEWCVGAKGEDGRAPVVGATSVGGGAR